MKNYFCVDIGGSKLLCGAVTPQGEIIDMRRTELKENGGIKEITELIAENYSVLKKYNPERCGIAVPGICDPSDGRWIYSPFSGIENIPIANEVKKITGLPVFADNDVNVSALGERSFGICGNRDDFIWITVSNGIGGGLFLNGKLYHGCNFSAGEIGHLVVEENGLHRCGCGNYGCLEAVASGASISKIYKSRTGKSFSAKEIADFARKGEPQAKAVWSEAGEYIGKAAACAVNLLGLEAVVLGGGAAKSFELLEPFAKKAMEKYLFGRANPNVEILHSSLGDYASLKGCAALAHKAQCDD